MRRPLSGTATSHLRPLLGPASWFALRRPGSSVRTARRRSSYRSHAGPVEVVALVAASVDLYWLVFFWAGIATFGILLVALLAWAGLRLRPRLAGLHGLAMCAAGVLLTYAGQGPFADASRASQGVALLLMFVVLGSIQTLMLALGRHERDLVGWQADEARRGEPRELTLTELRRRPQPAA